jgi:hypothetical protein
LREDGRGHGANCLLGPRGSPCLAPRNAPTGAIQRWLEQQYPKIARRAKREKALICWGDKRFADPAWNENRSAGAICRATLARTNALDTFIESTGLDSVARQRVRFIMSLLADSVASTNTLLGNLATLKNAIDFGGRTLLEGSKNLLAAITVTAACPPR